MLVRAGNDGEWLQLQPISGIPSGGFRSLCGPDAANLLELDTPMPVAAFGPWPAGSLAGVDAVCLTRTGDIELVVGTWGEEPRDTLWRMLDVAGALRGTTLEAFASHLTELGDETSVTRWLHQRVGGDAPEIEARLRQVLESGDFGFVLVTQGGAGALAQPLQFLQLGSSRIRVFEVEVLRAGDVQAIEGVEVPLVSSEAAPSAAMSAETVRQAPTLTVVPEPAPDVERVSVVRTQPEIVESVLVEPEPVEAELDSSVGAVADAEEPESFPEDPEAEDMPAAPEDPSDVDAFFRSIDRLDHRTSGHLRWLHDALLRLVDEAEYTTEGDRQFLTGWMHGTERLPLFLLDSRGLLQLVIASLPEHEQREYADEVAGMLPATSGSMLLEVGYANVDVPVHLDDQTLLEYLVDNLVEALPGGRDAFGTGEPVDDNAETPLVEHAEADEAPDCEHDSPEPEAGEDTWQPDGDQGSAERSSDGADFFAGVSGSHDASDVETAVAGLGGHSNKPTAQDDEPVAEPESSDESTREWAEPSTNQPKQAGSRWLRRRGAA